MLGLSAVFFAVCFGLRWCTQRKFKPIDEIDITLIPQDFEHILNQYKEDHLNEDFAQNINLYFLYFLNSTNEPTERPKHFYDEELEYHEGNVAEVFACIHQNFDERVCELIINSAEPRTCINLWNCMNGLMSCCVMNKIKSCFNQSILSCNHSLRIPWFQSFLVSWIKLWVIYIDVTKDLALTCSILFLVGGPASIAQVPFYFTSIVVMYFFCSIFIPLIISSIHLAFSCPGMIFGKFKSEERKFTFYKKAKYCVYCLICTPFNAILLENQHEKLKQQEEYFTEKKDKKLAQVLKKRKKVIKAIVKFQKIELATEAFLEAPAQILLLLLANTATPTTGGLETVYNQAVFLGIKNIYWCLLTSIAISLHTCIDMQANEIITEKQFLPLASKVWIYIWGFFATVRRIMGLVAFFIPSFGLFDILYHWQAEQTPFQARLSYASQKQYLQFFDKDQIDLYKMSEPVSWSEFDRWNYDGNIPTPTPPPYSLYTVMSLEHTFAAIFVLSIFQCFVVYLFKLKFIKNFGKEKIINQIIHVLENMNISIPFRDWDYFEEGKNDEEDDEEAKRMTVNDFRESFKAVSLEMLGCYLITAIFLMIQLAPLWLTSK